MRRIAWVLLLVFTFTLPWEHSLNLDAPLGNVARIAGLLAVLAAIAAVLQGRRIRRPGSIQWLALPLYFWICCSFFWTTDRTATLNAMRGSFQEIVIVWLVWEFAETPQDLRALLRVFVAGSWVLAVLTLVNFSSPEAILAGQYRIVAYGHDPNGVARLLVLGFPLAALLANSSREEWLGSRWPERILAVGYLPLGFAAVLFTASRGGILAALVALIGCGLLLGRARAVPTGAFALPAIVAGLWLLIPREVFDRIAAIPEPLSSGDLSPRLDVWSAGWHAFTRAPIFGAGVGNFVIAAHLAPIATAHNMALSLAVSSGLVGLCLAICIFALAVLAACLTEGVLRAALLVSLLVLVVTSMVATVEQSSATWLLIGVIALAGRLAVEDHTELAECFPDPLHPYSVPLSRIAAVMNAHGLRY